MQAEFKEYPSMIGDSESHFFIGSLTDAFEPLVGYLQMEFDEIALRYMYRGSIWYENGLISHFYQRIRGKNWICITEQEERYIQRVKGG